jgi:hypothetical protein
MKRIRVVGVESAPDHERHPVPRCNNLGIRHAGLWTTQTGIAPVCRIGTHYLDLIHADFQFLSQFLLIAFIVASLISLVGSGVGCPGAGYPLIGATVGCPGDWSALPGAGYGILPVVVGISTTTTVAGGSMVGGAVGCVAVGAGPHAASASTAPILSDLINLRIGSSLVQ